jgi:hypothetical protein
MDDAACSRMRTSFSALGLSALTLLACSGTVINEGGTGPVVTPSGLTVDVAIASATLGDEGCGGTVASMGSPPASGDVAAGACAPDVPCPPLQCRKSSVQLAFTSSSGGSKAKALITKVILLDATTDAQVAELSPLGNPQVWNGASYIDWDSFVAPSSNVKTQHSVTTPSFSSARAADAYSKQYRFRITVTIDGKSTTVTSEPVNREAPVQT